MHFIWFHCISRKNISKTNLVFIILRSWKFLIEILWSAIYCQLSENHLALLSLDMSDSPHFTFLAWIVSARRDWLCLVYLLSLVLRTWHNAGTPQEALYSYQDWTGSSTPSIPFIAFLPNIVGCGIMGPCLSLHPLLLDLAQCKHLFY